MFEMRAEKRYFLKAMKNAALDVLSLYQDEHMTHEKSSRWIKDKCTPSKETKKFTTFVKSKTVANSIKKSNSVSNASK